MDKHWMHDAAINSVRATCANFTSYLYLNQASFSPPSQRQQPAFSLVKEIDCPVRESLGTVDVRPVKGQVHSYKDYNLI
jgi:hypothetical protein